MSHMPLISIIVPIYNAQRYLEDCLISIQNQDYQNIEVVMMDDGSSDSSAQICKSFADKDPRFVYYYQDNAGVSAARNNAIDKAHGELLGFVDSDDYIKPDMYSSMLCNMTENDADVAITSFVSIFNGKPEITTDSSEVEVFDSKSAIIEMHKSKKFAGHMWSKLIKRSLFVGNDFPIDIAICEDMLVCWNIFLRSKKIVFCNNHKYFYRIIESSALNSAFKESFLSIITATTKMHELMQSNFPDSTTYSEYTVLMAYISVLDKLYYSKRLNRDTAKKYREQMKPYMNPKAVNAFWWHFRFLIKTLKLGYPLYLLYQCAYNTAKSVYNFFKRLLKKK